jgi:hypothetical protein
MAAESGMFAMLTDFTCLANTHPLLGGELHHFHLIFSRVTIATEF